jgi:hypothetical protein
MGLHWVCCAILQGLINPASVPIKLLDSAHPYAGQAEVPGSLAAKECLGAGQSGASAEVLSESYVSMVMQLRGKRLRGPRSGSSRWLCMVITEVARSLPNSGC